MNIQVVIGVNKIYVQSGKIRVALHDIAVWNEFGTQTAPPRPAFRLGTEKAIKENEKAIEAYLANVFMLSMQKVNQSIEIKKLLVNLLHRIGKAAVKNIKQIIETGATAPNAPSTVKKKGFDHPLFVTGTLMKNVNYEIKAH